MIDVDVVVLGGGIQGLVLLNVLVRQGYTTVLVTNADLGQGQTLHSHGVLNSGYLFPSKELRQSVTRDWLPFAQAHGVQLYGDDDWYIVTPPEPFEQLRPLWDAADYRYKEMPAEALPPGFACNPEVAVLKVKEYNYPKRQMVRALSSGLVDHIVRGDIISFGCTLGEQRAANGTKEKKIQVDSLTIRLHTSGEQIILSPKALVSAAGAGTRHLFESLMAERSFAISASYLGDDVHHWQANIAKQLHKVTYRRTHMLCVRAPQAVLPAASLMTLAGGLFIAGHLNRDHDCVAHDGSDYVTWYVTPLEQNPLRQTHAPHTAHAEVSPEVVVQGFNSLLQVFPAMKQEVDSTGSRVEFAAFAGYKQDIGEHPAIPVCEPVDGMSNVILALPSVTTNAWINARTAVTILETWIEEKGLPAVVPGIGQGVQVGMVNELMSEVNWMPWHTLVQQYRGIGQ